MELVTSAVIAASLAATAANEREEKLKKQKFFVNHMLRKKIKGENNMYDIMISLMGKEVKVLTIMGVVPGKVTEVTDSSVTLMHKHYKQIINIEYIITVTEKVLG